MTDGPELQALRARLARRIRELRGLRHYSLLDMVRFQGFNMGHWQKLEHGDLDARLSTLKKVADALGVTLSELFEGV